MEKGSFPADGGDVFADGNINEPGNQQKHPYSDAKQENGLVGNVDNRKDMDVDKRPGQCRQGRVEPQKMKEKPPRFVSLIRIHAEDLPYLWKRWLLRGRRHALFCHCMEMERHLIPETKREKRCAQSQKSHKPRSVHEKEIMAR